MVTFEKKSCSFSSLLLLLVCFTFYTVLSQWDFSHGKFGLLLLTKASLLQSHATQPTLHAMRFSVSMIQRTPAWATQSYAHLLMHATAHGGVWAP